MKRKLEETSNEIAQYDTRENELNKELREITQKKLVATRKLREIEREIGSKICTEFVTKLQFHRIPSIKRNAPLFVERPDGLSLSDCFNVLDIGAIIITGLGPFELSNLSSVCVSLRENTIAAFWLVAPIYMDVLLKGVADYHLSRKKKTFAEECQTTICRSKSFFIEMIKREPAKRPRFSSVLCLMHHFFAKNRLYFPLLSQLGRHNGKERLRKEFTYVYNKNTQTYTHLSEYNLYKIGKYKQACDMMRARYEEKGTPLAYEEREMLYYMRYDELCKLSVLHVSDTFEVTKDFVFIRDDEIRWLTDEPVELVALPTHFCHTETGIPTFIDHCEARSILRQRFNGNKNNLITYKDEFQSEHIRQVSEESPLL